MSNTTETFTDIVDTIKTHHRMIEEFLEVAYSKIDEFFATQRLRITWIDIDIMLPEEGQEILACGLDCRNHVFSGAYSTMEYRPVVDYGDRYWRFKYWMPAPEVPEEIKEKFQR